MADLELWEHPRCRELYVDPDHERLAKVNPDAALPPRRVADLLGARMDDVEELTERKALRVDDDGKVRGAELLKFHAALRPVHFRESAENGSGAADDETDEESATSEESPAPAVPAAPVATTTVIAAPAPAPRPNPASVGDDEEAGETLVSLPLRALARLLRGEPIAQLPPTRGGR